jgi:hypothetical protein
MSITKAIKNVCHGFSGACIAAFILLFYTVGSINVETLHGFSHHERETLHSAESESNPCHIRIYHEASAKACDHPTHFSEDTKCSLCDSQIHNSHLVYEVAIVLESCSNFTFLAVAETGASSGVVSRALGRAPPVC